MTWPPGSVPGCDCGPGGAVATPLITTPINVRAQTKQSSTNSDNNPTGKTTGWEPLILACPAPVGQHYWLVTQLHALISMLNPPQDPPFGPGSSPGCGLFLVPTQDIGETLAQAQAGLNYATRTIGLDTAINATFNIGTGLYDVQYVWRSGAGPIVVPQGWQLIAIATPHPGSPQPGPGAGSVGVINALVSSEIQIAGAGA